jgi:phosphomannomutase
MQETEKYEKRDDLFSKVVRAGKRTYFFDVKATRTNQQYLTITESKRRFNEEQGKFFYEKHKVFLYGEDFDKFRDGLNAAISFIETGEDKQEVPSDIADTEDKISSTVDVSFEDLGDDTES